VGPKEQLRELVEALPDDQVARALNLLRGMKADVTRSRNQRPRSLAIGDSGRSDITGRVDELLAEGFGR
jgi:hypothetical protein